MSVSRDKIKKWRAAHPDLDVLDEGMAGIADFPSLSANDFVVYMEAQGRDPQVVAFVKEMAREMVWAYDMWAKAVHDGDPRKLINDILNCCGGQESPYGFVRKFLLDYAKANNISVHGALGEEKPVAPWEVAGATDAPPPLTLPQGEGYVAPTPQPITEGNAQGLVDPGPLEVPLSGTDAGAGKPKTLRLPKRSAA